MTSTPCTYLSHRARSGESHTPPAAAETIIKLHIGKIVKEKKDTFAFGV